LITARILDSVLSVNSYDPVVAKSATSGDAFDVYFQLVDNSKHKATHGYYPEGLRYIPATGASVEVTVLNLDSSRQFVRAATQPFSQDASIWKISILSTDPVAGTVSLKIKLTESGQTKTFILNGALRLDGIQETC
jgi:hypothetical protein